MVSSRIRDEPRWTRTERNNKKKKENRVLGRADLPTRWNVHNSRVENRGVNDMIYYYYIKECVRRWRARTPPPPSPAGRNVSPRRREHAWRERRGINRKAVPRPKSSVRGGRRRRNKMNPSQCVLCLWAYYFQITKRTCRILVAKLFLMNIYRERHFPLKIPDSCRKILFLFLISIIIIIASYHAENRNH